MVSDVPEVSIIIPVYNEAGAISSVIERAHRAMKAQSRTYEIVLIDDGSDDDTSIAAGNAGVKIIRHPYNIGNGAAVKTGIRHASGNILVMLDGDGQHAPEDIPRFLDKIGTFDMVVGARNHQSKTSFHRNMANLVYNWFASYVCGRKIEDLTSGFRAIKKDIAMDFLTLLPNTFSYPTTMTLAIVRSGYSLLYLPIKTSGRIGKSKIQIFKDGSRFFFIILKIATLFSPMKVFIPVSMLMFMTGLGYGLFRIFFLNGRYGPTSATLMIMAVVVFMVGLVSEQVAQLRFDRSTSMPGTGTTNDEDKVVAIKG